MVVVLILWWLGGCVFALCCEVGGCLLFQVCLRELWLRLVWWMFVCNVWLFVGFVVAGVFAASYCLYLLVGCLFRWLCVVGIDLLCVYSGGLRLFFGLGRRLFGLVLEVVVVYCVDCLRVV